MIDLTGKSAVVTGGSRGIGRAIVLRLATQGADVAFSYRGNVAAAGEVTAEVEAMGDEQRLTARYERFRRLGEYAEVEDAALAGI